MNAPDMPHLMLISVMDRTGRKSHEVRQLWRDAYLRWLRDEMRVYAQWHDQRVMNIAFLRVIEVCEPPGLRKEGLGYCAAELAQQFAAP